MELALSVTGSYALAGEKESAGDFGWILTARPRPRPRPTAANRIVLNQLRLWLVGLIGET
jgi:hypothetical protein